MTYRRSLNNSGTFASRPSTAPEGSIYLCTDGAIQFIMKSGVWQPYFGSMPLVKPPTASNFTVSQTASNASLSDFNDGLFFQMTQRLTAPDVTVAGRPNPGGTGAAYTVTIGYTHIPGGKNGAAGWFNYNLTGIGIYNTSTTEYRGLITYSNANGENRLQLRGATGLANPAASVTFDIGGYPLLGGPIIWMRIQDDGTTNRIWYTSTDGTHFEPITSESRTTGFTTQPDSIGIFMSAEGADARMDVCSFQLTSP